MRLHPFKNRLDGGQKLVVKLVQYAKERPLILAIPRGGVVTALPVCRALKAELDLVITRKLPIPWNPEAGFGAVALDGTVCFNPMLTPYLGLAKEFIDEIVAREKAEAERRNEVYRGGRPFPRVAGRTVILVDDGLASGYTMLAAVRAVKKRAPKRLIVAVPGAARPGYDLIRAEVDEIVCLCVSEAPIFAVGSLYSEFPPVSDTEVMKHLQRARETVGDKTD
jgi:putative phosphoribosyl transferase